MKHNPFYVMEHLYYLGDKINKAMKKSVKLEKAKVVSIGNVSTGGTGKTPATVYFAELLKSEDYRIGILSRGYGGTLVKKGAVISDGKKIFYSAKDSGDEPALLAENLPGVPVAVGQKRSDSGKLLQKKYKCNLFLLDDGFQHYALHRDVDIVLIDATNPFGNGHLLPHGILREPLDALRRSDIIILTKTNQATPAELENLEAKLKELSGHQMIFLASHKPEGFVRLPDDGQPFNRSISKKLSLVKKKKIWAFSGIGSHRSFENTLFALGAAEVQSISFRDHHSYSEKDVENILRRVDPDEILITTEKDWVKLREYSEQFKSLKNFYYLKIGFHIEKNEILLREGLKAKILAGKVQLEQPAE